MANGNEEQLRGTATFLPRRAMMHGVTLASAAAALGAVAGEARAADASPFPTHPRWRLRLRQPRYHQPVLRPHRVRHRGCLRAPRLRLSVDGLGDRRRRADG